MYPTLNQSVLFDVTLAELADGAGEGCILMKWILKYINDAKRFSQPNHDNLVMKWDLSEYDSQRSDTDLVKRTDTENASEHLSQRSDRDLVLRMDIEDAEYDISCIRHFSIWNKRTRPTWGIPNRSLFGIYTYPGEYIDYQVWPI